MNFRNHAANVFGRDQLMVNEDAADDEHAILGFYLATHFAFQSPATGFDLPRCQRGGKRAL